MTQVYLKGIKLEKEQDRMSWETSTGYFMRSLGDFIFGVHPSWDPEKTSLMMQVCHMTQEEVDEMVRTTPMPTYIGLLEKIRNEMGDHKVAKVKLTLKYEYE